MASGGVASQLAGTALPRGGRYYAIRRGCRFKKIGVASRWAEVARNKVARCSSSGKISGCVSRESLPHLAAGSQIRRRFLLPRLHPRPPRPLRVLHRTQQLRIDPGSPQSPIYSATTVLAGRCARISFAGHTHAGAFVILSLLCQILTDGAVLPDPLLWFVRIGVPLSAILISAGFFFSVLAPTATQANGAVALIYAGAVILALAVVTLGIGLL